ncbi:hypothetical protein BIV57_17305 [Mangrovactinospora gilvigrisea]|uniref:Bacterioferritin-associated ferredoxin n=1 Tax=Mangrovactinospora gilvigrisea TaxID=1428644 RepID=A0A1J7C3W6_9ACTN|nr:(2Fe-2S)-binding protein [Mangrovactinospora gilvigrisea]OIV36248.1 hypothetical protein BIV57_17305 [Mangrovactinospora gilvigrisea]
MYVCSCFAVTEEQVRAHRASGCGTPRAIAGRCGAGTDCGGCVRRIQALLDRGRRVPEPVEAIEARLDAEVRVEIQAEVRGLQSGSDAVSVAA